MSIIPKLRHIPDAAKHIMLMFLGFTLHNRRYIARISREQPIFNLLHQRPIVTRVIIDTYYDMGEEINIYDNTHSLVSFDLDYKMLSGKHYEVKVLEIHYSSESYTYEVKKQYYDIDMYDKTRHLVWCSSGYARW